MRIKKQKPRSRTRRPTARRRDRVGELLDVAMTLSDQERHELAAVLVESLREPGVSQSEIDAAWVQEIARRLDAFDSGKVTSIPAKKVHRRIEERLRGGAPR